MSRSHAALTATTEAKPETPGGLQVYSNLPRKAVLSWTPSEQRAVAGYGVYRCPTMAGPWEHVAFAEGRLNTVYEDAIPGDLRVMYYRISAVNRFGGESEMTEAPIRAVTKAEPLPPIGLAADAHQIGQVDLRWAPNVETDVQAYEVWRSAKEGSDFAPEARIATVEPANAPSYADTAVGCGETRPLPGPRARRRRPRELLLRAARGHRPGPGPGAGAAARTASSCAGIPRAPAASAPRA